MINKLGRFVKGSKPWNKGIKTGIIQETSFKKGHVPWSKGKKFSKEHKERLSLAFLGRKPPKTAFKKGNAPWNKGKKCPQYSRENHHNWKGGKIITSEGYIVVKSPNHPFCGKRGYIYEHRLVMERKLGKYLKKSEVIHHINGNKLDNRINNLYLCKNHSEHRKLHILLNKGLKII